MLKFSFISRLKSQPLKAQKAAGTALVLLMAIATLTACGNHTPPAGENDASKQASVSTEAANQTQAPTLLPMNIAAFEQVLADARSKNQAVVIDFWGTWCAPCVKLMGPLHDALKPLGDQVRLVSVAWDFDQDAGSADPFADEIALLKQHHALKDAYYLDLDQDPEALYARVIRFKQEDPNAAIDYPVLSVYGPDGEWVKDFSYGQGDFTAEDIAETVKQSLQP